MSLGLVGSKRSVDDVYPLHNKKVFVLVDPENIIGNVVDDGSTIATIDKLIRKGAAVVVASSFGSITGITLNLSRKERDVAINAFAREGGLGLTHFLSAAPSSIKLSVLRAVPDLAVSSDLKNALSTGKTTLFASLSNEQKLAALRKVFPHQKFVPATTRDYVDALKTRFRSSRVTFARDCLRAPLHELSSGDICVLENLRFYKNETSSNVEERVAMAEALASGLDIFINDSFVTVQTTLASNVDLPRLLQHGAAGYSMDRELAFFSKLAPHSARPLAAVLGGACTVSKMRLARSLVSRVDRLFIAGAMAFPFLVARGVSCGLSYAVEGGATHFAAPASGSHPGAAGSSSGATCVLSSNAHGGNEDCGVNGSGVHALSSAPMMVVDLVRSSGGGGSTATSGGVAAGATKSALEDNSARDAAGEMTLLEYAKEIIGCCDAQGIDLILPVDHRVVYSEEWKRYTQRYNSNSASNNASSKQKNSNNSNDTSRNIDNDHVSRCARVKYGDAGSPIYNSGGVAADGVLSSAVHAADVVTSKVKATVPVNAYIVDCGAHTINIFSRYLRDSRTVFWAGAFGDLCHGFVDATNAFAAVLSRCCVIPVVCDVACAQAVHACGLQGKMEHVSGAARSCMAVLLSNPLPGVEALCDVVPLVDQKQSIGDSVIELIRHLPLFANCNTHQMNLLAKKFTRRVYKRGDYIVCEGDCHTWLHVVAQGALVAQLGKVRGSLPARYIPKGHTIGMYEFITQSIAIETARAAYDGTVMYQLSHSALHEILHTHTDLATQLLGNAAESLRAIAQEDYERQSSATQVTWRSGCRTRVPQPEGVTLSAGMFMQDVVQDVLITITMQSLTMSYAPYTPVDHTKGTAATAAAGGAALQWIVARTRTSGVIDALWDSELGRRIRPHVYRHAGLAFALLGSVIRNVVYRGVVGRTQKPYLASVVSAIFTSPIRLRAYGLSYSNFTVKRVIDEALYSVAVSCAPLIAYATAFATQVKLERLRQSQLHHYSRLMILAIVKIMLAVIFFPILYQRNFHAAQNATSRLWDSRAFWAYAAKQVLATLQRDIVRKIIMLRHRAHKA